MADDQVPKGGTTRRGFLTQLGVAGAGLTFAPLLGAAESKTETVLPAATPIEVTTVKLTVNGRNQVLNMGSRVTLLDALRERLLCRGQKRAAITANAVPAQFRLMGGALTLVSLYWVYAMVLR